MYFFPHSVTYNAVVYHNMQYVMCFFRHDTKFGLMLVPLLSICKHILCMGNCLINVVCLFVYIYIYHVNKFES